MKMSIEMMVSRNIFREGDTKPFIRSDRGPPERLESKETKIKLCVCPPASAWEQGIGVSHSGRVEQEREEPDQSRPDLPWKVRMGLGCLFGLDEIRPVTMVEDGLGMLQCDVESIPGVFGKAQGRRSEMRDVRS